MTTIQIEAQMSTEQLLRAVDQLPPNEFAAFLAQLLDRVRGATGAVDTPRVDDEAHGVQNPYLVAAGMFADDSFAAEVDAYIAAQRQREREEAAREADA